jgi:acetate kinase
MEIPNHKVIRVQLLTNAEFKCNFFTQEIVIGHRVVHGGVNLQERR